MGYHAIVNGGTIPVYSSSGCGDSSHCGDLYNGEVFVRGAEHSGYQGVYSVKFLNPSGLFASGFIRHYGYGNLMYSGTVTNTAAGTGYAFYLRRPLNITKSGVSERTLPAGSIIYTNNGIAGESNPQNMAIIGYAPGGFGFTPYTGFVTLDYTAGSMFASNFCLKK